jgi:hypothetical protein
VLLATQHDGTLQEQASTLSLLPNTPNDECTMICWKLFKQLHRATYVHRVTAHNMISSTYAVFVLEVWNPEQTSSVTPPKCSLVWCMIHKLTVLLCRDEEPVPNQSIGEF